MSLRNALGAQAKHDEAIAEFPAVAAQVGTAAARVQILGVGDPAPKLDVKSFVKGEPIKSLEPGKLYVVEFWATWCGPCRVSIPHLTELQKKHVDVVFIGVSIWEHDQNAVKPFVDTMGDRLMASLVARRCDPGERGRQRRPHGHEVDESRWAGRHPHGIHHRQGRQDRLDRSSHEHR